MKILGNSWKSYPVPDVIEMDVREAYRRLTVGEDNKCYIKQDDYSFHISTDQAVEIVREEYRATNS